MINANLFKKLLILIPSIIVLGLTIQYYLYFPLSSSLDIVTLLGTVPSILGIIFTIKPSKYLKACVVASALLVIGGSIILTGKIDPLTVILNVLIAVGASI
jgi:hypothetical protein